MQQHLSPTTTTQQADAISFAVWVKNNKNQSVDLSQRWNSKSDAASYDGMH